MKRWGNILVLVTFYAVCETGKAKHVDLKFHPLTAAEVYKILEQTNQTDVIPAGRIITQGIMAESKTVKRRARILQICSTSGESQTVLQEICFSSRSLQQEAPETVDENMQQQARQEPTTPTGTATEVTGTGSEPPPPDGPITTVCGGIISPPTTGTATNTPTTVTPVNGRELGNNKVNHTQHIQEDSNEKDKPEGRQEPTSPSEPTEQPPTTAFPMSPPDTTSFPPLVSTPTSCLMFSPSSATPTATSPTAVPGNPGSVPTAQPTAAPTGTNDGSSGGNVNCIVLNKVIRR